jgi:hypothetical protein
MEFKTVERGIFSTRALYEVDCGAANTRINSWDGYSGRNLTGNAVPDNALVPKWEPIPPGSFLAYLYTTVCPKS